MNIWILGGSEARTLCISFPFTQLKDGFGGRALYLVTKPSFSELHDKMHIDSFAFVFIVEKEYALIEQSAST